MLLAVIMGACFGALISMVVAHGTMKPLMQARGVSPWTLRDTIGSTMLVTIGAALEGSSAVLLGAVVVGLPGELSLTTTLILLALLAAPGALCLRLGLIALRKLT